MNVKEMKKKRKKKIMLNMLLLHYKKHLYI